MARKARAQTQCRRRRRKTANGMFKMQASLHQNGASDSPVSVALDYWEIMAAEVIIEEIEREYAARA